MECIPNSVGKKKCKYVNDIYNVSMFDSKQCIKKNTCKNNNDILSPSEDICYDKSYNDKCSSLIDKNSVYKSALSKCECLNKFYYTPEEKGVQKICLDKNGECPSEYKYFVPIINECRTNCSGYSYIFNKLCLDYLPDKEVVKTGNIVDCPTTKPYWYKNNKNKYVCNDQCPTNDYLKVPFTETSKLCLNSCKGTHFPYYYNGQCYTSCANNNLLEIVNGFEVPESPNDANKNKANYTCKCLNPWYNDTQNNKLKIICSDSKYPFSISNCKNFTNPKDFKYMIKHTLECIVTDCPSTYPYHFNKECFKDCENDASSFYHYLVPKKDSYECECINLWFICK